MGPWDQVDFMSDSLPVREKQDGEKEEKGDRGSQTGSGLKVVKGEGEGGVWPCLCSYLRSCPEGGIG